MFSRGRPSRSMARAATISACVESSPPDTPITARSIPVACRRVRQALDLDVVGLVAILARGVPGRRARTESARPRAGAGPASAGACSSKATVRKSAARSASSRTQSPKRVDAHALLADAAEVDVGGDEGRIARKPLGLGEPVAAFEDGGVAVPGEVGGRFAGTGGRVGVGRDGARRLAGAEQAARLRLADGDVARRQVDEHLGAGQRRARRRRQRHPEILADLDMEGEARPIPSSGRGDRRRTAPLARRLASAGGERRRRRRNAGARRIRGSSADRSSARRRGSCRDGSPPRCCRGRPRSAAARRRRAPGRGRAKPRRAGRWRARRRRAARPATADRRWRRPTARAPERSSARRAAHRPRAPAAASRRDWPAHRRPACAARRRRCGRSRGCRANRTQRSSTALQDEPFSENREKRRGRSRFGTPAMTGPAVLKHDTKCLTREPRAEEGQGEPAPRDVGPYGSDGSFGSPLGGGLPLSIVVPQLRHAKRTYPAELGPAVSPTIAVAQMGQGRGYFGPSVRFIVPASPATIAEGGAVDLIWIKARRPAAGRRAAP